MATRTPTLEEMFAALAEGREITYAQIEKWFKQAKAYDKNITSKDTDLHFKKFKNKSITYKDFNTFLDELAKAKKMDPKALKAKLIKGGLPEGAAADLTKLVGMLESKR